MKVRTTLLCLSLLLSACFSSCTKEEKSYTRQELQQTTDSILSIKIKELRRQAREDLDRRLPIELKPKVDSILQVSYELPPPPEIADGPDSGGDSASRRTIPQTQKSQQPAQRPRPDLPLPPRPPMRP